MRFACVTTSKGTAAASLASVAPVSSGARASETVDVSAAEEPSVPTLASSSVLEPVSVLASVPVADEEDDEQP
jgi:hypothetical protein